MRRLFLPLFLLGLALLCTAPANAQGIMHGSGAPGSLTPPANCAFSRFYVDDSTGLMYQANSGSPCVWTLSSDGGQAVTFTAGPWLGSGAATPVCATGFHCTHLSGTVSVTTTGTPGSTGAVFTITWGTALGYAPSCTVQNYTGGSFVQLNQGYGVWPGAATTTTASFSGGAGGSASSNYAFSYNCRTD